MRAESIAELKSQALVCVACGASKFDLLPNPHPSRSMISDARIYGIPLSKTQCKICDLVRPAAQISDGIVRAFYAEAYDLGLAASASDIARARHYAEAIIEIVDIGQPREVLEVGCGAGHVLNELAAAWPNTSFRGIDAAPQLGGNQRGHPDRVSIRHGFLEDQVVSGPGFDLVFAINVIEHAADPSAFLRRIVDLLAPEGIAVLVLPAAHRPNLELLFADHIHSLSPLALSLLAQQCNLTVARLMLEPEGLGDFQIVVLRQSKKANTSVPPTKSQASGMSRHEYLMRWRDLDRILNQRCGNKGEIILFGAGETAALLRTYAPFIWSRTQMLLVDETAGARELGRPVTAYRSAALSRHMPLLLATHPRSQAHLAERLAVGHDCVVRFDDVIPR